MGCLALDDASLVSGEQGRISQAVSAHMGRGSEVRNELSASLAKLPNLLMLLVQGLKGVCVGIYITLRVASGCVRRSHRTIIQFLYPLTSGTPSREFADVLQENGGLTELRKRVISMKLSPRMRSELERKHFWRVHAPQEKLAKYFVSIRTAVSALDLPFSELQVIDNILDGMRLKDRLRITFARKPRSFAELAALLGTTERLGFADQQRQDVQCNYEYLDTWRGA